MNTTYRQKASEIYKDWHVIDAAGRPLGRVATEAATLLRGKHKPTFEPHLDAGDFVIVVNASKVVVTGRKAGQNRYYRHSGYPGGLKSRSYTEQLERFPEKVIEQCVWGMLPKGSLGEKIIKHLKVYRGPSHPHQSQITGSERSKAARDEAAAELAAAPLAPTIRLRMKLQRPAAEPAAEAPPVREAPVTEAAPEAPAKDTIVTTAGPESAVEAHPEAATPAVVAEATAEAPPRRTRRRAGDESAGAAADTNAPTSATSGEEAATAEEKPKRTRRRAATTEDQEQDNA